ncbi:hypothetical protein SAMN02745975_03527 [Geosporobacter subterraneus DSM 17957]|uniref:Uncharacterized protein n=1 Tax=Geosporobacter subterraneus DSM 17957 TaxID=1121919 RepID=A0A1M6PAL4_9FIRM|nr:hypothetical protein [Geosporobacter subterraneus]SHK04999.1 hypothetical protein SAMN02745975_03527 [Geosporobacter subterraneus DSM 17957]
MNKIKLMYDVVKTLKQKEVFKGTLKAEVRKDRTEVFSLEKDFEKDTVSGQGKSKIVTVLDYEGKKVRHESSTEFNLQDCYGGKHHDFIKGMHKYHHGEAKCCGFKGKLSKLAFLLNVLNDMEVQELDDKGVMLTIHIDEIPEDLKNAIKEKMNHKREHYRGEHEACCMKDFCFMEEINLSIKIQINKNNEINKVILSANGKQMNETEEGKEVSLDASLNLVW